MKLQVKYIKERIKAVQKKIRRYLKIRLAKNVDYAPLSPVEIVEEHIDEYMKVLNMVINNDELNNVAITGGYGTGKSSIIKTFIKRLCLKKKQYSIITIGSYFKDESIRKDALRRNNLDNESDEKKENKNIEDKNEEKRTLEESRESDYYLSEDEIRLVNKIENAIIRQLLFKNNSEDILESNFKRLSSRSHRIIQLFSYLYLLWFGLLLIILKFIFTYQEEITSFMINNFYKMVVFFNSSIFDKISPVIILSIVILLIFAGGSLLVSIAEGIFKATKHFNFSVKQNKLSLTVSYDMAFAKELREIIAFFAYNKKCRIVFFEDIDRFSVDVSLKMVEELKELNTIINNSDSVEQNVTFIYSFKEDIFKNYKDKSKFYDYIISVMPISTFYNSAEVLEMALKKANVTYKISDKLLDIVANNIYDVRTLNLIVNDFKLFMKTLKTNNYDKVFAMVTFKNYYIKEYDGILEKDNFIDKRFNAYFNKKSELYKITNRKITELKGKIKEFTSEVCSNVRELKQLLWFNNFNNSVNNTHIFCNGKYYYYQDFMKDNFDMEQLRNNEIRIYGAFNNYFDYEFAGGKDKFFERLDKITNKKKLRELEEELAASKYDLDRIDDLTKNEVILEYGKEEVVVIDLLDQLIINNFIERDYLDYITLPPSNGLTVSDNKFIFDVKHKSFSEMTGITNCAKILEKLALEEFNGVYTFNVNLINFLINNKDQYTTIYGMILDNYKRLDDVKIKQIEMLYNFSLVVYLKFMNDINKTGTDIWNVFMDKVSEENRNIYSKMMFETILLLDKTTNMGNKKTFIEYANEYFNKTANIMANFAMLFSLTDNVKRNMVKLLGYNLRIIDLNEFLEKEKNFFINNGMYYYNINNMKEILKFIPTSLSNSALKGIREGEVFIEHIQNNFNCFAKEYYLENNFKIDDKDIIKKLLLRNDIAPEIKKEILKREQFTVYKDEVDEGFDELMFEYNHWTSSWILVNYVYEKMGLKKAVSYVYKNRDTLLKDAGIKEAEMVVKPEIMAEIVVELLRIDIELDIDKLMRKCLQEKDFKYESFKMFYNNEQIFLILEKNDLLKYGHKAFLKRLIDISLDLACDYLNKWYKSEKNIKDIYLDIKNNKKLIAKLLRVIEDNDAKMKIILEEVKKDNEQLGPLIEIAFKKGIKYQVTYDSDLLKYIFKTTMASKIFKNIKIMKGTIEFIR